MKNNRWLSPNLNVQISRRSGNTISLGKKNLISQSKKKIQLKTICLYFFSSETLLLVTVFLIPCLTVVQSGPVAVSRDQNDIVLGSCIWVGDRQCPDGDIKFYLFTKFNPNDRQLIHAAETWDKSNLSASYFDPELPTKVIMHGFNSDMYLTSLIDMKDGELINFT